MAGSIVRALVLAAIAVGGGESGASTFTDVAVESGLIADHGYVAPGFNDARHIAGGAAVGDYDRDGFPDVFVVRGTIGPDLLFHNRGDGTFEEVGAAAGVALTGREGSGPTFADVDGDGWLDLLVLGLEGSPPVLFRNLGDGTFADVTAAAGLTITRRSFSAAFGDPDRDGDLDLVVSHWGTPIGTPAEHLWQNDGAGHFTDVSAGSGIVLFEDPAFPIPTDLTFTPDFADIDDDGWPDLLVAADFGSSRVFHNVGGTFADVTSAVITDENGMGSAIADYDHDGDLDWFVSSIYDPDGSTSWGVTGNRLYRNLGGGVFEDATDAAGVRDGGWGWGSTFVDVNDDGHPDLFHVNGWDVPGNPDSAPFAADAARLFMANGDGTFADQAAALGAADTGLGRGVAAFDYDRDGDLDLAIFNNTGPARLLRNDGSGNGGHLVVRLVSPSPNTEGIGARISVTAGGVTRMQELRAGSNFVSQNPAEAHFGLGAATLASTLRVDWPGGATTELSGVAANRQLALAAPTAVAGCTSGAPENGCRPGSGGKRHGCAVEWLAAPAMPRDKKGFPPKRVECFEGDPRCDADLDLDDGSCTVPASLCINNADPRLPDCAASAVLADVSEHEPDLHALLRAVGLGTPVFAAASPSLCGEPTGLEVALKVKKTGAFAKAKRTLRIRGRLESGRRVAAKLRLVCLPSTCGDGVVQRHETCDDGNRLDGDGCDRGCQLEP